MFQIKQSEATAARRRIPVLLVDITDGFTPELGIVTPTINVSKNGAAVATGAGTWTEIGNGQYYYEFTAGEVDTLGWIAVNIEKVSVTRDYNSVVQVQAYDPFDVVRLGLTSLPSVASGSAGGIITSGTGTSQLNVSSGNVAGSVASVVGAVGSVTGNVGGSVASVTGNVGGSVASVTGAVGSVTGAVGSVTGNVGGNVTGSVGSFTTTAIQSIWDDLSANNTVVGSIGKLIVDNLNSPVGSVPANVWTVATRTITGGSLTVAPPTAAQVATQVWSEALPGTYTSGQAGFKLNAAGSAADPWSTALPGAYAAGSAGNIIGNRLDAAITSRMASFTLPTNFSALTISVGGAVTAGTVSDKTGYSLGASQTFSTTGSVGSVTGAVASVTGAVGSVTGNVGGSVTGSVGSVTGNVGGNVTGSVGSFSSTAIQSIWTNATRTITGGSLTVAPLTASETAGAVWNSLTSAYTTHGTYGWTVLRSDASAKQGLVTLHQSGGLNRVDADVHAIQNDTGAATSWKNILTGVTGETITANVAGNVTGYVETVHSPDNIVDATWNEPRTGHTTLGTFGYYLDAPVSGGGGGGGSTSTLRMGPFLVVSDQSKQEVNVDVLTGSSLPVVLQLVDVTGTGIPLAGATLTVNIYNTSGTLVTTYPGTASYSEAGFVTFTLDTVVTASPGTYYVTVTRTTGASDTSIYGGLRLYVRSN
jgi:hypothetical protein